jgi:hypothetical protein
VTTYLAQYDVAKAKRKQIYINLALIILSAISTWLASQLEKLGQ